MVSGKEARGSDSLRPSAQDGGARGGSPRSGPPINEKTLSIIKPDGVQKNLIGEVLKRFEKGDLRIVAIKMLRLTKNQAEEFYAIHRGKPFFEPLIKYMTSGPVVVSVLEGPNAISRNREIMGATDPKKAASGTIRRDFAESIDANIVHGSDAPETARGEIRFFFPEL